MLALLSFLLCFLLAGRVSATFNITVGNQVLFAADILAMPNSSVTSACSNSCSLAKTNLNNCHEDSICLCQASTVSTLLACEQCMLDFLVANFQDAPDIRAGSQAVLTAYNTACTAANQTLDVAATTLGLPTGWNGSKDIVMGTAGSVVAVIVGGLLGTSSLYLLANI